MQPYIMQCRVQAALQCSSPEPPVGKELNVQLDPPLRKSRSMPEKPPPPIASPVPTNVDSSSDRESFSTDAKSSPDADTEYGDLTDGPPTEECADPTWTYDSVGATENKRFDFEFSILTVVDSSVLLWLDRHRSCMYLCSIVGS